MQDSKIDMMKYDKFILAIRGGPEKIEQMDREMHFLISSSAATEQKYVCLFCLKKLGEAAPIVIVIGHCLTHWVL